MSGYGPYEDQSFLPPQPGSMSEIFTKTRVEVFVPDTGFRWAAHVTIPKNMLDDEPAIISHSLYTAQYIFEENGTG